MSFWSLRLLRIKHRLAARLDRAAVDFAINGNVFYWGGYIHVEMTPPELRASMEEDLAGRQAVRNLEYYLATLPQQK